MGDGESEDPRLDDRGELVGHAWRTALPGAEHLEPRALDHPLPAIVGRAVHPEDATGLADPAFAGDVEQLQAEPEQDVRIKHGAGPLAHGVEHHKHGVPAPLPTRRSALRLSRLLGGCSA